MSNFVPLNKKSKKEQKKFYSAQRGSWGMVNPVTKTFGNGKAYDRNKLKQSDRKEGRRLRDDSNGLSSFFYETKPLECGII